MDFRDAGDDPEQPPGPPDKGFKHSRDPRQYWWVALIVLALWVSIAWVIWQGRQ